MYNSHPSDGTYGNPGFYVANPTGKVRDASGRLVDLRPDESERSARRIMVRTSELQKNSDGVYIARIRKAKNVTAIKLSYASIPRPVSRVTAQLILYSIAIKQNSSTANHHKVALQRMCRNQLLSSDTSDVPFFRMSTNVFDWRNDSSISAWVNSFDRNTFIPPQLESEINNQYVDIDVLTVKVPSMCTLNNLGLAFSNALKSHSGAENVRNNSIWTSFDISVEDTGFSVFENINNADVFTTFAAVAPPYVTPNDSLLIRQNQSAVNSFIPMCTPLKIRMKKSRSVFVSNDTLNGASTSPALISPSFSNMTEFAPTNSGSTDLTSFETVIDTANRFVYSFSCLGDVSEDDILEVEYQQVVELHVITTPEADVDNPTFGVKYYYGNALTGTFYVFLRAENNSTIKFSATAGGTSELPTIKLSNSKFVVSTGVLTEQGHSAAAAEAAAAEDDATSYYDAANKAAEAATEAANKAAAALLAATAAAAAANEADDANEAADDANQAAAAANDANEAATEADAARLAATDAAANAAAAADAATAAAANAGDADAANDNAEAAHLAAEAAADRANKAAEAATEAADNADAARRAATDAAAAPFAADAAAAAAEDDATSYYDAANKAAEAATEAANKAAAALLAATAAAAAANEADDANEAADDANQAAAAANDANEAATEADAARLAATDAAANAAAAADAATAAAANAGDADAANDNAEAAHLAAEAAADRANKAAEAATEAADNADAARRAATAAAAVVTDTTHSITVTDDNNATTPTIAVTDSPPIVVSDEQSSVVRMGSSFFHQSSTGSTVTVSEVRRTYQKTRDIRLGLRWGYNKENEDFFIDTNHSLDSPLITDDQIIQSINPVDQHRRDVALLSQYSKTVKAYGTYHDRKLNLTNLQPTNATIIPGMFVSNNTIQNNNYDEPVTVVSVSSLSSNTATVTLSQEINVTTSEEFTFEISPTSSTYHNMLRNTGDLEDTYVGSTTTSNEIYNVHQVNDAHQIQRMLFTGHMMNVTEPSPMPIAIADADYPHHDTSLRPRVVSEPSDASKKFYVEGLGWQTSIVHAPTRFMMPAFPCRFTEINDYDTSIYSTTLVPVQTSVSPLVSRILNPTRIDGSDKDLGYYKLNKVDEDGAIDATFNEKIEKEAVYDLSCYVPRVSNTCGIVVTIGNENYVVKKAHLISVLRNETEYTLDLNCDRNYNKSPRVLSSVSNLRKVRDALKRQGYRTDKEHTDLQNKINSIDKQIENAFHNFYEKTDKDNGYYQVDANAKYFSWVYELDRPVQLPTGISAAIHNPYRSGDSSTHNPPVTNRTFNGISDAAALFTPGIYERNTGRCAVTNIQECAHSFSVRSGSQESENSLLVLHGIGSLERPVNSTHSTDIGDVFAVMGSESDLKKPEKLACDATTFLRSPENIDSLNFHFMNSKNGQMVDIGNQNATLIFDIYCSNE